MAKILDGKVVRDKIAQNLKLKIENLKLKPALVIIQVGNNPESSTYIGQKIKFGQRIGALVDHIKLPKNTTQQSLSSQISKLNTDNSVHGIIVQMPIPNDLDKELIINTIDKKKDVDGLTDTNQQLLANNDPYAIIPATPKGVISLMKYYKIPIKGKKVTVIGRSKLVGAPLATILTNLGAQVTVGHSQTPDLTEITKSADIIIVAVGKPNLITKDHVSPGQTIIDVGINVVEQTPEKGQTLSPAESKEKGLALRQAKSFVAEAPQDKPESEPTARKLLGDVNFAEVEPIVATITPVPGGIGPMTVASLFENLLEAYKNQNA